MTLLIIFSVGITVIFLFVVLSWVLLKKPEQTELDSPLMSQKLANEGHRLIIENQMIESLEKLNQAIALDTQNAKAFMLRGMVFSELNQIEDAIGDLSKAVDIQPSNPDAHATRATIYLKANHQELGMADLNRAIELDPNHFVALMERMHLYKRLKMGEAALADFKECLRIKPDLKERESAKLLEEELRNLIQDKKE